MNKFFKYARCAAYLTFQRSFVSSRAIENVLQQEFEQRSMLFQDDANEAPIKVAVTACNSRDSTCSIITSYNRPLLDPNLPYKWLQANDDSLNVKIWEA